MNKLPHTHHKSQAIFSLPSFHGNQIYKLNSVDCKTYGVTLWCAVWRWVSLTSGESLLAFLKLLPVLLAQACWKLTCWFLLDGLSMIFSDVTDRQRKVTKDKRIKSVLKMSVTNQLINLTQSCWGRERETPALSTDSSDMSFIFLFLLFLPSPSFWCFPLFLPLSYSYYGKEGNCKMSAKGEEGEEWGWGEREHEDKHIQLLLLLDKCTEEAQ